MQHLGRLIYEVFSQQDNQSLPTMSENSLLLKEPKTECNKEGHSEQRSSKQQRQIEKSFFSVLLEAVHFPVSICRLLSDLIDVGRDGKADCPFTNLEDIVEDLEQMCSQPRIYLDDPESDFCSSSLRFGTGCYGRSEQVTSVLRVASRLENSHEDESECAECLFISGIAGSGKSFFIQSVGDYLTSQGWLVLGAKFESGLEDLHESQGTVSSLFGNLIATLVRMKNGKIDDDIKYSRSATRAIIDALDRDSISSLSKFLPNIKDLVDDNDESIAGSDDIDSGNSYWQLVFLLSTMLAAVLSLGESFFACITLHDLNEK